MTECYVLDSFAVLAYLRAEPGGARVQELLEASAAGALLLLLSLINYGEVAYIAERKGGVHAAESALALLDQLPIDIVAPSRVLTMAAARIKASYTLSYADAFAAALAQAHAAPIVTGDPEFGSVASLIQVEWLPT